MSSGLRRDEDDSRSSSATRYLLVNLLKDYWAIDPLPFAGAGFASFDLSKLVAAAFPAFGIDAYFNAVPTD